MSKIKSSQHLRKMLEDIRKCLVEEDSFANYIEVHNILHSLVSDGYKKFTSNLSVPSKKNAFLSKNEQKLLDITYMVADHYGFTLNELRGKKRTADLVRARHIAIYLCRHYTSASWKSISNILDRHHSTAIHAYNSIETQMLMYSHSDTTKGVLCISKGITELLGEANEDTGNFGKK